jgi:glycosyltransferase involved in cell wall biosynthesis
MDKAGEQLKTDEVATLLVLEKRHAREQWTGDPCGSNYGQKYPFATREYFDEVERHRYEVYAPWMPAVMGFDQFAGARLRARRPDVFAIATEQLAWQRGQNSLMLFGALAGARIVVMLDMHNGFREESRAEILRSLPSRLTQEAAAITGTFLRTRARLRHLERAVKGEDWLRDGSFKRGLRSLATGETSTWATGDAQVLATNETMKFDAVEEVAPELVYLRATPGAGTQVGGATSHINGVINALLEQGARVRVVSNDRLAGLDEARVALKIIEPKPLGTTRAAFDLYNNERFTRGAVREIAERPPEFIYQRYSRFSWAGVEATLETARPLFLEYNGSEVWVGRHWDRVGMLGLLARFEALNLKAAARIFVVSEVERCNLLRAGIAAEKIIVNPNGVDAERFQPHIGGSRVRAELGIEADETLVGFVGTFGPWHGVTLLAKAIALMPTLMRVRFLLVGSGVERAEVERILREGEAEGRVIFTGAVGHERVPALLDACDVLVSPHVPLADGSDFFGSPTKLFEYMAMGKAIVASRLGQIADVLVDEETALMVEPGNARELCEAIMRLAQSPALCEKLGAAARAQAVANHTWKHNAGRVLEAYRAWVLEQHG